MNLKDKKNPGLRAAVVSGDIVVDKFCKMSSEVSSLVSFSSVQMILTLMWWVGNGL